MSIKNFLIISLLFLFFNIKASDSKKKSINNSKTVQQISAKAKSSDNQKDKQELKLTEKTKRQTEEEMLAQYQAEAIESRKDIKILEKISKINFEDLKKLDSLFIAIAMNDLDQVKSLISKLPVEVLNRNDKKGRTILSLACFEKNLEIVQELLKKGVNPNIVGKEIIETPLIIAAAVDCFDVVKVLLVHQNIDPNIRGHEGVTALMIAVQKKYLDIVKLLLAHSKTDPNIPKNDGTTPLIFAAKRGNLGMVEALLTHLEIELNVRGSNGITALMAGVEEENLDIVKLLLAHKKTDPNISRNDRATPLMLAVQRGNLSMVEALLAHRNIDPNIRGHEGVTALMIAVQKKYLDIVKALLAHSNTDPNISTSDGATALVIAVQNGDLNMVEELLNNRADIDIDNDFSLGTIAIFSNMISPSENRKKIIKLLDDYGAVFVGEELKKIFNYICLSTIQNMLKQDSSAKTVNNVKKELNEKLNNNVKKELDEKPKIIEELLQINEEENKERNKLFALFEIEKQQMQQAGRLQNRLIRKLENFKKEFEQEKIDLESLAKSKGALTQSLHSKTFEDIIQEKGGLTDHQKKIAQFHFEKLLTSKHINSQISQDEDFAYSSGKNIFGLGSVLFDWSHILNVSIGWEYDFKTKLHNPSFEGGHSKETIDRLIQVGLVKKISEKKWKNGCFEYILENIWTGKRFSKTVFPQDFDVAKIYTVITQGKMKDKKDISEQSFLTPRIEYIVEYQNILIKVVLVKKFFGYEIITAFPIEKIETKGNLPSVSVLQNIMPSASYAASPAARSS